MASARNLINATFLLSKSKLPFSFSPALVSLQLYCLNIFILRSSWPFNVIELRKIDLKGESRSCCEKEAVDGSDDMSIP